METGLTLSSEDHLSLLHKDGGMPTPFSQEIFLIRVVVAGTSHVDTDGLDEQLVPDCLLKLRRRPDNPNDELAIAVLLDDRQIGWVPMQHNLIIAHLMDAGKLCNAKVYLAERRHSWLRVEINIFMVD